MKSGYMFCLCSVVLLLSFLSGCRHSETGNSNPQTNLNKSTLVLKADGVQPAIIDLGKVLPDSKSQRTVPVINTTDQDIVLGRFQSSCECTEIVGLPLTVGAGKTADLTLNNDLGKEPGFIGSLAIMIDLFEKDQVRGKLEVQVTVSKDIQELQKKSEEPDAKNQKENTANQALPDSPITGLREPTLAPPRPTENSK